MSQCFLWFIAHEMNFYGTEHSRGKPMVASNWQQSRKFNGDWCFNFCFCYFILVSFEENVLNYSAEGIIFGIFF